MSERGSQDSNTTQGSVPAVETAGSQPRAPVAHAAFARREFVLTVLADVPCWQPDCFRARVSLRELTRTVRLYCGTNGNVGE